MTSVKKLHKMVMARNAKIEKIKEERDALLVELQTHCPHEHVSEFKPDRMRLCETCGLQEAGPFYRVLNNERVREVRLVDVLWEARWQVTGSSGVGVHPDKQEHIKAKNRFWSPV